MKSYKELYAAAKKTKAIRQLTPDYLKWEEVGEQIIGAYLSQNVVTSRLGGAEYNQYIFETDDGRIKFALGRSADSEFAETFARGVVYAITYEGKEDISGGRRVNRFNIEEVGVSDMVDGTETDPIAGKSIEDMDASDFIDEAGNLKGKDDSAKHKK